MFSVPYGKYLGSTFIKIDIIDNLPELCKIIKDLEYIGFKYISHNRVGIIYDYFEGRDPVSSEASVPVSLTSLDDVQIKIELEQIKIELEEIKKTLKDLEANTPTKEEVTEEFYILFDLLPEHIKKELKIYINK